VLNLNFNDDTAPVGVSDAVAQFDGTGGIEIDSSTAIDNTTVQQRTVTLSFVAEDVDARQVLFEEGGASRGLNVYIDGGKLHVGAWDRPAGFTGTFLSTAITAGTSYSVTLILDTTNTLSTGALRGHLNGTPFASGSAQAINQHASGTAVGAVNGKTRFHDGASATGADHGFVGLMDNLRIYNRAIDEDKIMSLFQLRLVDGFYGQF
ncbi:MAG: LamG-like jellyroll fold domain-containing protein, partial [Rubripirellula sp.]